MSQRSAILTVTGKLAMKSIYRKLSNASASYFNPLSRRQCRHINKAVLPSVLGVLQQSPSRRQPRNSVTNSCSWGWIWVTTHRPVRIQKSEDGDDRSGLKKPSMHILPEEHVDGEISQSLPKADFLIRRFPAENSGAHQFPGNRASSHPHVHARRLFPVRNLNLNYDSHYHKDM